MGRCISLDSSFILSAIAARGSQSEEAAIFLAKLLESAHGDVRIIMSSIACYEVRRGFETERAKNSSQIDKRWERFEALFQRVQYVELSEEDERLASLIWGRAVASGLQTEEQVALGADALIAATSRRMQGLVLTSNTAHFRRYYQYAYHWGELSIPIHPGCFPAI